LFAHCTCGQNTHPRTRLDKQVLQELIGSVEKFCLVKYLTLLDKQVLQELTGSALIQQVVVLLISSQIKISKICVFDVLLVSIFFDLILMSQS
jgi:hypothetical protein